MSPTPKRRRTAPPDPYPETGLAELGLSRGDAVRFRRNENERWKQATVSRRERDGSVGMHDPKGASRSIPVDCIEVRSAGPRGGVVWEPLTERAARTEQMPLVAAPTRSRVRRGGSAAAEGPPPPGRPALSAPPSSSSSSAPSPDDEDPGPDGQLVLL